MNAVTTSEVQADKAATTYGAQVFAQLRPIFERSCCESYQEDFHKHDRRLLDATALPGMEYLWAIRTTGTHLVPIGVTANGELVKAILRESDPAKGEIHHVAVTRSGCRVGTVDPAGAVALASAKPLVTMKPCRAPFAAAPTLYTFYRNESQIATASVTARYSRDQNRTLADVSASIPEYLDSLLKMHVTLLIEEACTAEASSLFWSFGQCQVNEMPYERWLQRLTRRAVLAA